MKEYLSQFHVTLLLYMTQSGTVIITLPRLLAVHFGTNGWLGLLAIAGIVSLNLLLISAVYRLGNGQSIFVIMESSIPKFILYPFYVVLASLWAIIGCLVAKQYVLIFQMIAFPTTNPMLFKLVLDVIAFLLIIKNIYNIAKAATVFFLLIFWMMILMFYFFGDFQWSRLTPFIFQEGHLTISSFSSIYTAFLGYEVCLLLFPYTNKKTKLIKAAQISNLMTTLSYLFISLIIFGFYGYQQLKTLQFPLLNLLAYIQFPFVQGTQNLLFGFLMFSIIVTIVMYWWGAKEISQRVFRIHDKLLIFLILLIVYCVSYIPNTISDVENWLTYLGYTEMGIAFTLPIGLILLVFVQRMRGKTA